MDANLPPTPIWKRGWFWIAVIVGLVLTSCAVGNHDGGTDGGVATSDCLQPADAWLDTLRSGFLPRYRDANITSSAYVEADTSEGTAYYVAVTIEGVSGVAVFGTDLAPLQSDPGLIAGANWDAGELSNYGIDIPEDSPAGELLLDEAGTFAAAACL